MFEIEKIRKEAQEKGVDLTNAQEFGKFMLERTPSPNSDKLIEFDTVMHNLTIDELVAEGFDEISAQMVLSRTLMFFKDSLNKGEVDTVVKHGHIYATEKETREFYKRNRDKILGLDDVGDYKFIEI